MTPPPGPDPGDIAEREAALIEALGTSADQVADRIFHTVMGEIPGYQGVAEGAETRIHDGAPAIVNRFVAMMQGGQPLTPAEVAEIETMADLSADAGVRGEDMSAACWVAARVACEVLAERAEELPPSRATVAALGRVMAAACEFVQEAHEAVARGHLAHHARHTTQRARGRRDLVDDLITGQLDDEDGRTRAERLGVQLGPVLGVVVIVAPQTPHPPSNLLRRFQASCLSVIDTILPGPVVSSPLPHAVVLMSCPASRDQERAISTLDEIATADGFVALVDDPVDEPSAVSRIYDGLATLLPTAAAVAPPGVARRSDFAVYRFLSGNPEIAQALAREALGPVLDLPEAKAHRLLETLDALWEAHGNVRNAADRLHLSAKAVRDRLHRLHELTGLDPALPPDRLRLDLARHALRLEPEARPAAPMHAGPGRAGGGRTGPTR